MFSLVHRSDRFANGSLCQFCEGSWHNRYPTAWLVHPKDVIQGELKAPVHKLETARLRHFEG